MLNIDPEAFYTVENPADSDIVWIAGPFQSSQEADSSLTALYRTTPEAMQIVFTVTGEWLLNEAVLHCTHITG